MRRAETVPGGAGMTDDEVIASVPAAALALLEEKWGKHQRWVECPVREEWNYACMLEDRGLLEMHVDTPPYFVITDLGRRVLPAVAEFRRAHKALGR